MSGPRKHAKLPMLAGLDSILSNAFISFQRVLAHIYGGNSTPNACCWLLFSFLFIIFFLALKTALLRAAAACSSTALV